MSTVFDYRADQAVELASPKLNQNGYLVAQAALARTGVLEYLDRKTGQIRRELVLPEELKLSVGTLAHVPVTNEHPPTLLTPANTREFQVGFVHNDIQVKDDLVVGSLTVMDQKAIVDVMDKKKVEVSPGYVVKLEKAEEGAMWNGQPYDYVQRERVYNHLAIVEKGRNGSSVAIRTDSAIDTGGHTVSTKLKIKGVDYEMTEQAACAVRTHMDESDMSFEKLKKKNDELTAKCESLMGERDQMKKDLAELKSSRKDADEVEKIVADRVSSRLALLSKAAVAAPEMKLDGLTDSEIVRKVVSEKNPEMKLDGLSDEYIKARFDIMCEKVAVDKVQDQARATGAARSDASERSSMDVRKEMIERQKNGGK